MSFGSAFGQDRWVIDEVFSGKRSGFFVEAGALNGVDESNTVVLERDFGWNGICVEPNSAYFEVLRSQRRCVCVNACLYDEEKEVEFVEAGGHGGIPQHFSADYGQDSRRKVFKKALPLAAVLERNQAPQVIDYLSLDTEGSEYVILKDFPFDRYRILAMTLEHNHNAELRSALARLLKEKGYVLARSVLVDDWYVHESIYRGLDEDLKTHWRLLGKFPPSEASLRAQETLLKYEELREVTRSIPRTGALFLKLLRKRIRGKRE